MLKIFRDLVVQSPPQHRPLVGLDLTEFFAVVQSPLRQFGVIFLWFDVIFSTCPIVVPCFRQWDHDSIRDGVPTASAFEMLDLIRGQSFGVEMCCVVWTDV